MARLLFLPKLFLSSTSARLIAVNHTPDGVLFTPVSSLPSGLAWAKKQLSHTFSGCVVHAHEFVAPTLTNEGFVSTLIVLTKTARPAAAAASINMIRIALSTLTVLSVSSSVHCRMIALFYPNTGFIRVSLAAPVAKDAAYLVPLLSDPDAFIFINVSMRHLAALITLNYLPTRGLPLCAMHARVQADHRRLCKPQARILTSAIIS